MRLAAILKIVVSWVLVGVLFGGLTLYLLNPLAGLTFLIIVASALMVLVAPIAHVGILWFQQKKGKINHGLAIYYMVIGVVVVFLLLAFSGLFDFA